MKHNNASPRFVEANERMPKTNDDTNKSTNEKNVRDMIGDNSAIMMFTSSLVKHAASPELRLPANFVGVQSVRQDFQRPTAREAVSEETISRLKAANDVKFCVVDQDGNERRMTKAEKKARKFQIVQAKKEAKKREAANRKRNLEQITHNTNNEPNNLQGSSVTSSGPYHQLPLDSTTLEQELAEFQGKRGSTPPVILSPPMALQFVAKKSSPTKSAEFAYDHTLSQEWANRLKEQCVLPAEAVREKEDLRPLAYRLQPEPWQRLRPSLEETSVATWRRGNRSQEVPTKWDFNPKPNDWAPLTCRPRFKPSILETNHEIQHDDIVSIVFEYIHRETPYYISCGAKFGSDFLVYDGPRDKRHAFAGLRVLSRFTNSMTGKPSKPDESTSTVELPLPTAYSLTGFVRCLNTAGKLALLATVDEVSISANEKKRYRVAIVDVALEKVLDVHKRKNRGRSKKKKLQKRRDVTQTLSKT